MENYKQAENILTEYTKQPEEQINLLNKVVLALRTKISMLEKELKEKNKEKIQKIEEIKSLLSEQNLSIDDLIGNPLHHILKPIKVKKKVPPKYRLVDLGGTTHEWTGRGIAPKVFQQHFDRGHSKESCLIVDNIKI